MRVKGPLLGSPQAVRDYLRLRIGDLEHEVFVVLFLDAQHRLIAAEEMFRGTLARWTAAKQGLMRSAAVSLCSRAAPSIAANLRRLAQYVTYRRRNSSARNRSS